ncbi:unnamed protein product [Lathyrus oleraceus]|uniref:BHLH domain-containing protein n=1 Tax=Pisum sativum TaxID=3888 RepID=A0A9D4WI63_PEA|nr:transcription factor bHLH139-like [Pisum sativum]KAI5401086.1 hypothetical protein KIW84_065790 [Pisum sativum]
MEPTQLISQEWDSLSGQYTAEEADFMTQFLGGNYSCFPSNANFMCFPQGSSSSTDHSDDIFSTVTASNGPYLCDPATHIDSLSMFFSPQYLDDSLIKQINYEGIDHERSCLEPGKLAHAPDNNLQAKREHEMMFVSEEDRTENMENPAKRFRSSNASMELNEGTCHEVSNLCRKSRARNGPATDSQSIYARRRRERINERLRILQTLVPNGTKVDISTMLEEAVQYVKFLQLQIKVLSSDDMWMYAPIAYNGINIGLDLSFS